MSLGIISVPLAARIFSVFFVSSTIAPRNPLIEGFVASLTFTGKPINSCRSMVRGVAEFMH
jgi:hypothetical protein